MFPLAVFSQYIFGPLLFLLSFFIIAIILLQRGRGGGLTGALGGLGGQSAFGVKAGDIFTRITAGAVLLWIFVAAFACYWYKPPKLDIEADLSTTSSSSSLGTGPKGLGGPSTTLPTPELPSLEPKAEPTVPESKPQTESPTTEVPSVPADATKPASDNPVPPPAETSKPAESNDKPADQPNADPTTTPPASTEPAPTTPPEPAPTNPEPVTPPATEPPPGEKKPE